MRILKLVKKLKSEEVMPLPLWIKKGVSKKTIKGIRDNRERLPQIKKKKRSDRIRERRAPYYWVG